MSPSGDDGRTFVSPVTIWIGVCVESTAATVAHDAAMDILKFLSDSYEITDIDVDFRGSTYVRTVGPELLPPPRSKFDPLLAVTPPITSALGVHISTKDDVQTQGTMALYLAEGGEKDGILGLSCRHVLVPSSEPNVPIGARDGGLSRDILVLGKVAFNNFLESIKLDIHVAESKIRGLIEAQTRRKAAANHVVDAAKDKALQIELKRSEEKEKALHTLLDTIEKDWRARDRRVLGSVLFAPPITLGAGSSNEMYTEDWGVFRIDREKLGPGFQGNVLDLASTFVCFIIIPFLSLSKPF